MSIYVLFASIMQKSLLPPKCACVANGDVCVGDVVIGGSQGCRITLAVSKCVYNLYAFDGSFAVMVALERCGEMIPGTTALQSSTVAVGYYLWDHARA